jgi:hypothetical protein
MAYAGGTSIIIPKPLTPYVGLTVLELGMCICLKQVEKCIFTIWQLQHLPSSSSSSSSF